MIESVRAQAVKQKDGKEERQTVMVVFAVLTVVCPDVSKFMCWLMDIIY